LYHRVEGPDQINAYIRNNTICCDENNWYEHDDNNSTPIGIYVINQNGIEIEENEITVLDGHTGSECILINDVIEEPKKCIRKGLPGCEKYELHPPVPVFEEEPGNLKKVRTKPRQPESY